MRQTFVTLFFLASALPIFAAQEPTFGESVEVRIANIDVVVTTKDGRHVEGLTPDDFELLVGGKPLPISHFAEYRMGAPLSSPRAAPSVATAAEVPESAPELRRKRAIVFFVDSYSLDVRRRQQAMEALRKFARETLLEGDEAMVVCWNRRLTIPLLFTADHLAVDAALLSLEKASGGSLAQDRQLVEIGIRGAMQEAEVSGGSDLTRAAQIAYGVAISNVNHFGEEQRKLTQNMTEALIELFRGMAGVDAKKIVVILSENLPRYPGLGLYQYTNDMFARFASTLRLVQPQMAVLNNNLSEYPRRVTAAANENEIVLHTIYSGDSNALSNVEDRSPGEAVLARYLDFTDTGGTFAALSRDTGGVALIGSTNFAAATQQISADLQSYYSLAYRVPSDAHGTNQIEIRPRNHNLVVRARRTWIPKPLDEQIADRVTSHLVQQSATESEEIVIRIGDSRKSGRDRILLPIEISFPVSLLTLLEQEGQRRGGFEIAVAARDDQGHLSEVAKKRESVAWPLGKVPAMVSYKVEVELRNRPGMVSVGVIDALSKTPYFRRLDVARK